MGDEIKLVTELLNGQLQEKTNLVAELTTAKKGLEGQVTELTTKLSAAESEAKVVSELRGIFKADAKADVLKLVGEMQTELFTLRAKARQAEVDGWIAEFVKLEALRPTIALHLGEVKDKDGAKARVEELMKRDDIKLIANALVRAKAGPPVIVTELSGNGGGIDLDTFDTPEARAAAQRRTGI